MPGGEVIELEVGDPFVQGSFVYSVSSLGRAELKLEDPCGRFLDQLLGVVFARPAYLRPEDVHRYASLIQYFRAFRVAMGWGENRTELSAGNVPLQRLGWALARWVEAERFGAPFSLMPTFALDAARFIQTHACGRHFWAQQNESWEIRPMVPALPEERLNDLDDPRMKKDITQGFAGMIVTLDIPDGCRVRDCRTKAVLAEPGTACFSIERCHLSSGIYDHTDAEVEEDRPPKHDVATEFELRGKLYPVAVVEAIRKGDHRMWEQKHGFPQLEVPGRWITAYLEPDGQWVPVPRWAP
jgi:hypothetical protein